MSTKPIPFFQTDNRWKEDKYAGNSMKVTGCAPAIAASLIATLKNLKVTPSDLAKFSEEHECIGVGAGTYWSFWSKVWNHYGFTGRFVQTQSLQTLTECIDAGGYVVCATEHIEHWRTKPYILVYDYDDTFVYYIGSLKEENPPELMFDFENETRMFFCFWPDKIEDDDGEE